MATPAQRFVPTWGHALRENALVAMVLPAICVLFFALTRGLGSVPFALVFGAVFGAAQFAYLAWRFHRQAPREVVVDERSLRLEGRDGRSTSLPWEDVVEAAHGTRGGRHWRFAVGSSEGHASGARTSILLRDDGFTIDQWDALKRAIHHGLDEHRATRSSERLAAAFDDDEA